MLDALFNPKTVAVVGVSSRVHAMGNRVLKNLIDFGFKGRIYPVNPKADTIQGLKAFKSVVDIPEEDGVDVVHVAIPARFVPGILDDCGKMNVKNVVINSGGFSETGPEGEALERDVLEKAKQYGIRILGPNCQGIINTDPAIKAYCNFAFTKTGPGAISIVALSGGVAELIHQAFSKMGMGTRLYASNGNACDISIPEIIRYFSDDEGTAVIVTYVEGIKDARGFLEAAKQAAAKKPVLAMKAGRTKAGERAAASHTGTLAKAGLAADLFFKGSGIISCATTEELVEVAAGFALQPVPKGNRVVILTNTGGPAVIAADTLAAGGCELPPLPEKTRSLFRRHLPPEASANNPVDVLPTGSADHYHLCLNTLMNDDVYDAVYISLVTSPFTDMKSVAELIVSFGKKRIKPIVCNLLTERKDWADVIHIFEEGGIPLFDFPESAARCLAGMGKYHQVKKRFQEV